MQTLINSLRSMKQPTTMKIMTMPWMMSSVKLMKQVTEEDPEEGGRNQGLGEEELKDQLCFK